MAAQAHRRRQRPILIRMLAAALLLHVLLFGILVGIGAWTVAGRTADSAPQYVLVELIAAAPASAPVAAVAVAPPPAPMPAEPEFADTSPMAPAPEAPDSLTLQPSQLPADATGAGATTEARPAAGAGSADAPAPAPAAGSVDAPEPVAASAGLAAVETPDDHRLAWERLLLAHLDRHKRYPARAQWLGQEGVVQLEVRAERDGQVLAYRVVGGSGHALLDDEALALIRRAEPLPPPPPQVGERDLEFRVPVEFFIERRAARLW